MTRYPKGDADSQQLFPFVSRVARKERRCIAKVPPPTATASQSPAKLYVPPYWTYGVMLAVAVVFLLQLNSSKPLLGVNIPYFQISIPAPYFLLVIEICLLTVCLVLLFSAFNAVLWHVGYTRITVLKPVPWELGQAWLATALQVGVLAFNCTLGAFVLYVVVAANGSDMWHSILSIWEMLELGVEILWWKLGTQSLPP